MFTQEVTVNNEVGLHARPATYFIQKANVESLTQLVSDQLGE